MTWKDIYRYSLDLYRAGQAEEALRYGLGCLSKIPPEAEKEGLKVYDLIYQAAVQLHKYSFVEEILPIIQQLKQKHHGATSTEYASILNNLGYVKHMLQKYEEAIPLYHSCLKIYHDQGLEGTQNYAQTLYSLADAQIKTHRFSEAIISLKQCISLRKVLLGVDHDESVRTQYLLAKLYLQRGSLVEAAALLEDVIQINAQKFGKSALPYLDPMQTYARVLEQLGDFERAENLLLEGKLEIEQQLGKDNLDYAMITHNLGECWLMMGRYEQGEKILRTSLALKKQFFGEQHEEYAYTLNNLAIALKHIGNIQEAETAYTDCMVILQKTIGKQDPYYADTLSNLGYFQIETGKYSEAVSTLSESLELDERVRGTEHPAVANTLSLMALLCTLLKRYDLAQQFYLRSLDIYLKLPNPSPKDLGTTAYNYGVLLHEALQQSEEASTYYHLGISQLISFIAQQLPALSEAEKQALLASLFEIFNGFGSYVIARYPSHPAIVNTFLEFYLVLKGVLAYSTQHMRYAISQMEDKNASAQFETWLHLRKQLGIAYKNPPFPAEVTQWEEQANLLERSLSQQSHDFAQNQTLNRIKWAELRNPLKEDAAAIEVIRIQRPNRETLQNDILYIFLIVLPTSISQSGPDIQVLEDGNSLETEHLASYRHMVLGGHQLRTAFEYEGADPGKPKFEPARLFDLFWGKIHAYLSQFPDIRTLYFSPDGVYHLINVETLFKDEYVADRYKIHLLPSTRDLLNTESPISSSSLAPKAVLIGAPDFHIAPPPLPDTTVPNRIHRWINRPANGRISELPGAQKEIKEIGQILLDHNWLIDSSWGKEATVEALIGVQQPRVLHIATHGYFSYKPEPEKAPSFPMGVLPPVSRNLSLSHTDNPLYHSGLLFAGAQAALADPHSHIGIFSAFDASNLNLIGTELVVLSACETAVGPVQYGEGIYGLQRAFMLAGARTLICSLWRVDDAATQRLMTDFYTYWLNSGNVREAFRLAQQDLRAQQPDPFYWGAFVILGA